jgi:hypothetical protein
LNLTEGKGTTLHPQVRGFLDAVAAQNRPDWETATTFL